MTSKEALNVLRCAYKCINPQDLTDEDVKYYHFIGKHIINESTNELIVRKQYDKDSESKG